MKKETILMMLENLTKCKKFNSPEGLPVIENFDPSEDYLNLTLTECYKDDSDWLNGFNTDPKLGWSPLAITWVPKTEGKVPYLIFGDDRETDLIKLDPEQLAEYLGINPSIIEALILKIIKDLHTEIIAKFSDLFNLDLINIHGFCLPRYLFRKGLNLDFNYQGTLLKTGYRESWVSKSLEEILLLTQYEAVKAYLSINS
jgi:hypothetical protein